MRVFTTKEWKFGTKNTRAVWDKMNDVDKKIFQYIVTDYMDLEEISTHFHLGIKKYLMREKIDAESIEKCRRKYKR